MINFFSFSALTLALLLRLSLLFLMAPIPRKIHGRALMRSAAMWSVAIGAIALFWRGVLVPAPVLDAALGGVNRLHWVRNLFVVMAVWCLRKAVFDEMERSREVGEQGIRHKPRFLPVLALMTAFSVLFYLEETGPTTSKFIPTYVHQENIWAYASVYMLGVGIMALEIARYSKGKFRSYMGFFAVGGSLMAAASGVELAYMWLIHFDLGPSLLRDLFYGFFQSVFYIGIALVALGLSIRPIDTAWSVGLRVAAARLAGALRLPGAVDHPRKRFWTAFWSRPIKDAAYDLLIRTRDHEIRSGEKLPASIQARIRNIEKYLDEQETAIPKEIVPTNG